MIYTVMITKTEHYEIAAETPDEEVAEDMALEMIDKGDAEPTHTDWAGKVTDAPKVVRDE